MAKYSNTWRRMATGLVTMYSIGGSATVAAQQWQFSVMPYLWLPTMEGNLRYGPPAAGGATPSVTVDADTLLGALDFALMVQAEARKGKWFLATDLIKLNLSSDSSHVKSVEFNPGTGPVSVATASLNLATETEVKGTVWTLVGGYSPVHEPQATFSIIAGFRYLDLEANTRWNLSAAVPGPAGTAAFAASGGVARSDNVVDGIVGVAGRYRLGSGNWFVPYHLDVGGGDSKLTWQGVAGIGYSYKWGEVLLAYRYLSYEMGGTKPLEDVKIGGLGLGLNFRF